MDRCNTLFTTKGSHLADRCSGHHDIDLCNDDLKCYHNVIASQCESKYETMGTLFSEIYDRITDDDIKNKMIEVILKGHNKYYDREMISLIHTLGYNEYNKLPKCSVWNKLCKYIRVDVNNFCNAKVEYSDSDIYRLMQIGKDLSIEQKLKLYYRKECKTLIVGNKQFVKEIIYNLEYLKSQSVFELKDLDYNSKNNGNNRMYGVEIYNSKLLDQVKDIRCCVFGKPETDVDVMAIPLAYKQRGLFWDPVDVTI